MKAFLSVISFVVVVSGCAGRAENVYALPVNFCDVRDHLADFAGKVVSADVIVSESIEVIVVRSAACPEFGLGYDEEKTSSIDNQKSLERFDDLLLKSYRDTRYTVDNGIKVVSVRLVGRLVRSSGSFTGVVFRAVRAEHPKVIEQPREFRLGK